MEFFNSVPRATSVGCILIAVGLLLLAVAPWLQNKCDKERNKKRKARLRALCLSMVFGGAALNGGGAFLTARDSLLVAQQVASALATINGKIAELPADSPQRAEAQRKKDEIEDLADKLSKQQHDKMLAIPEYKLGPAALAEARSLRYRPVVQGAIETLRRTVETQAKKQNKRVQVTLADCPENFCASFKSNLGDIEFLDGVRWEVAAITDTEADKPVRLRIWLESNAKSPHGAGQVEVAFYSNNTCAFDQTKLYAQPNDFQVSFPLKGPMPLSDFDKAFRELMGQLTADALLLPD